MNIGVCGVDLNGNAKVKQTANIVYSTFINFEAFFLRFIEQNPNLVSKYFQNCSLLIDEADSILIDELTNGTILSRPMNTNGKEILVFVYNCKMDNLQPTEVLSGIKELWPECTDINEDDIKAMYKEIDLVRTPEFQNGKKYCVESMVIDHTEDENVMLNLFNKIKDIISKYDDIKEKISSYTTAEFYEFLKVPRRIQYEIISNDNLRIESEDSLFDIVTEIIEICQEKEEISDVMFLEQIEFTELSEDRLCRFVDIFDCNEMSGLLWNKLSKCLLNQTERKRKTKTTTTIIVGGYDKYNQLGEKPNIKGVDEYSSPVIFTPLNLSLDSSSLLSYSVYRWHSVLVTRGGSLLGIGNNSDGQISSSLTKTEISQFTEFSIKDDSGRQLAPISAVCSGFGTLYMFSKISGDGRQLVYCDYEIKGGDPVFLDIGDEESASLFGGHLDAAAISDKGEVIFINRNAVQNSPNSQIAAVSLPDGEKASSVACLKDSVFVLSSSGRVFSSIIETESSVVRFSEVSELSGYEIVWVSGTFEHCLAVSKEGRVFGFGSNSYGQLGLGEETESVSTFTEISSLLGYEIRAAYAGSYHSLFETREGKTLSCGSNLYGQLLLSSGPSEEENVYSPRETTITGGATFCIAGNCLSSVFVGGYPPVNTPNMRIQHHQ